ncbi:FtsX-like permease family protein [Allofournierella massiliensis]|uniref:Putative ABC transport system permease protein n=1 Tax=Allofournierella massiliensis TaxID=1650663 RepID=A0A4R1QNJ7_9FIRM|nr:ABC transporter permease [Fournierella massiliensis]TCL55316.1 putative ABC transport system permease protein [Fournierella massiliensis]
MYAKLVFRNARRSIQDYLVYILTMTICVTLFYSFLSISSSNYDPDIGTEYDFTMLSDGMKLAICAITLFLLFLIRFVNNYMLRRKQREFALQSIMGMEQRTIGRLFFAETFLMGLVSIVAGIFFGVFCSQFITAMLLTSYGKQYEITWTLFPDTVLLTVAFFVLSFLVVGLSNTRAIRKLKIIDMLTANRENGPELRKSRWIWVLMVLFEVFSVWMCVTGVQKVLFYWDSRFALPVQFMFWGNILFPAMSLLWPVLWALRRKKGGFTALFSGLLFSAFLNTLAAASVPMLNSRYLLALGGGAINQYLLFVLVDLIFLICVLIYLVSSFIVAWKEGKPEHRYKGENLFFFGQIISKLSTTSKTMSLTCVTLVLAIFLFIAAPVLVEWASGYLDARSMYDVQIYSRYNDVYEEANLPQDDYDTVTDYLTDHSIETAYDCTFSLYLPNRADFHNRVKYDFPVVAIALSDYNTIREMLGYEPIFLADGEFTTHWQTIATTDERDSFLRDHTQVQTDAGTLTLAEQSYYEEAIGQTAYNSYTNVLFVFPDSVCAQLLPVMRNRYITTTDAISYDNARELEQVFTEQYPELADTGVAYSIRLSTLQINSTRAGNFVLQAAMLYGAVVLMVICLTVLSLQQLLDAGQYRYRFSVLRKLGVEERNIRKLVLKQLGVWFGLPIVVAIGVSTVVIVYFLQTISVEISAYIGIGTLLLQIGTTVSILLLLLVGYFVSTWILFHRSIET